MNIRTKILALLLAASMILSLAACFGSTDIEPVASPEASDSTTSPEPSASGLPADFTPDPSVEDLYLATADIPGDFALFTINGQPVSARMYLYWLAVSISETEADYIYYGLPEDWITQFDMSDYLMADALNATLMYTLLPSKVQELGYELTDDQNAAFESLLAETIEEIGGEEEFNEHLRMLGLDRDTYLAISRSPYYCSYIMNGMLAGRPTDADVSAYVEQSGILSAKHILLLTMDMTTREPLADDVIAQKKATAEDILKQLRESDDPVADFDALMHQYSEDGGLAAKPDGYIFGSGEMVTEFEEGTRALEIGQISEIVESSYGYHIILRQQPDLNDADLRSDCLTSLGANLINTWITEATLVFSDEYLNLDVQLFYDKFIAYQAAFAAENSEES